MTITQLRPKPGRGAFRGVVAATTAVSAAATTLLLPLSGSALPQAAPANTSPPTISGTAAKDQTLVASTGTWSGTTPISFAFQWQRCDSAGADCAAISDATDTTYVVRTADVGRRLRVLVTASNAEGAASALSEATQVVTSDGMPQNTGEPAISGSPREGERLTATTGTWTGTPPISFAYGWVRCGSDGGLPDGSNCSVVNGANGSSYVLARSDVGYRIRVRVTATNTAGSETAASNATATVSARTTSPANTRAPSISGSMVEGSLLTANRGTWSGTTPITYSYQWLRCNSSGGGCAAIRGATGTQYRLTSSDVGRKVRLSVTARNSAGSATAMSGEYAMVASSGPAGVITLPSGEKSIPATSVPRGERLIVDRVQFAPSPLRSRTEPFSVQVRVKDTRGYVVRDALVFIRSTPLVTRAGQPRRPTLTDGWAAFQMTPRATFPTARRTAVQFFVKAYRSGDNPLAGVAGYRLVQVVLAR
jgi:hypothetical protein